MDDLLDIVLFDGDDWIDAMLSYAFFCLSKIPYTEPSLIYTFSPPRSSPPLYLFTVTWYTLPVVGNRASLACEPDWDGGKRSRGIR